MRTILPLTEWERIVVALELARQPRKMRVGRRILVDGAGYQEVAAEEGILDSSAISIVWRLRQDIKRWRTRVADEHVAEVAQFFVLPPGREQEIIADTGTILDCVLNRNSGQRSEEFPPSGCYQSPARGARVLSRGVVRQALRTQERKRWAEFARNLARYRQWQLDAGFDRLERRAMEELAFPAK